jgi:hypothetical protein
LLTQAEEGLTVANVVNLYAVDTESQEFLRRAIQSSALPESWRDYFRKRPWEPDVRPNSLWWTSAARGQTPTRSCRTGFLGRHRDCSSTHPRQLTSWRGDPSQPRRRDIAALYDQSRSAIERRHYTYNTPCMIVR